MRQTAFKFPKIYFVFTGQNCVRQNCNGQKISIYVSTEITLRLSLICQTAFKLVFFGSKAKCYEELWRAGVSLAEEGASVNAVGIGSVCRKGSTEIQKNPIKTIPQKSNRTPSKRFHRNPKNPIKTVPQKSNRTPSKCFHRN